MLNKLRVALMKDLKLLGVPTDSFTLTLKAFSKSYYGRYNHNKMEVILYVFQDEECTVLYSYEELLKTLVHELVHFIQFNSKSYIRWKGIMHDPEFWKLYNQVVDRIDELLEYRRMIREREVCYA